MPTKARPFSGFRLKLATITLAATALAGCDAVPTATGQAPRPPARQASAFNPGPAFGPTPAFGQCLADLGARAASFTPLPDQYYGAGCTTLGAVRLAALSADRHPLAVSNLGPVTCPLANTFADWARFGIDRAARQILGSPLVRIETMGSYSCRNIAGSEKRSAHSTGNAIDIAAFHLADGRRISVLNHWSAGTPDERFFLRTIHQSACRRFSTTLGPDYNFAHHDHFHVELSGSSFCK